MRVPTFFMICLCAAAASCGSPRSYFMDAKGVDRGQLDELFTLLDDGGIGADERFAVTQKIGNSLMETGDYGRLISFLSNEVAAYPDAPYNARYLLSIAYAYTRQGADAIAALYYDRIVKYYDDLEVNGESIHLACLRQLLALVPEPNRRIGYRQDLIAKFPDRIDIGPELFLLGTEYESLGEWESAIDAYRRFMPYYGAEIPGHPDAAQYARSFIDLATIPKDWAFETLDELIMQVKKSLDAGDARALTRLRAKVGFFAMDWHQDKDDGNSQVQFDLSVFMAGSRIRYNEQLDPSSNSREAFLRTTGWTERMPTWYLYFRKIDFPADPEVHGRWEWAGIYFGDKMQ